MIDMQEFVREAFCAYPRRIALIGFRATGKSVVGKILAVQLGWAFTDMDATLVSTLGTSIDDFVKANGWPAFRDAESKLLVRLAEHESQVVATGGGVVLAPDNRRILGERFWVVWLRASPETILERLSADPKTPSNRPPLTTLDMKDEVAQLLRERRSFYEQTAHHAIDTEKGTPSQIADEIDAVYRRATR